MAAQRLIAAYADQETVSSPAGQLKRPSVNLALPLWAGIGHTLSFFRKQADGRWLLARDANLLTPKTT